MPKTYYDVVIIGGGHNGLVSAAYLAQAGLSVLILEKKSSLGGATTSQRIFPDYDALLSKYSYLVSLFPQQICDDLGLKFQTAQRNTASFTAYTDQLGRSRGLVMSNVDSQRSKDSLQELTGSSRDWGDYQKLLELENTIANVAWPTLLQPLQTREHFRRQLKSKTELDAWSYFVERPIGDAIETFLHHDALRGLVMTDAKIGVFTHPHDESLVQNRCFLYHIIGGGTGEWRVPVGGMKSLVDALEQSCLGLGVEILTEAEVTELNSDSTVEITYQRNEHDFQIESRFALVNATPRVFHELTNSRWSPESANEGSVIKINMLLRRLPRVKAIGVSPEEAFGGSFHIDEGYEQMKESYRLARNGQLPDPAPGEIYCHTLTDPSILSKELQKQGFQTLTLFGLDMPYRLFEDEHDARRDAVKQLYLDGLDRICDESFQDCLALDRDGKPCVEIHTPQDIEKEIGLDQGNIFHTAPSWFFTDDSNQAGKWGVETSLPNVFLAGSSAVRGGAVSGIPGHNAAKAVLEQF